ncbi:M56 family metallopeptidase [Streptomyces sp. H10-C2]|uniref:M56 family metallopeptidase n=1 Tax=unclassified Streptomyces TaxID=2593676 RepID=UPI0024B8D15A|nr:MULTISPECIES: M56 family metallopeptidase [unclassified Streptomyces]MDJ0344005.1 M56 family metallopeptidase [Streptomyces sp. PH10-H1]MDJ0373504.1 M56 family metallopeptidase [Streptomyces sp. H10-C2]
MNPDVIPPLLIPLLAVPLARRLAAGLAPRAAAWLLACTAAVLAVTSTVALALLVAQGALLLPPVAALGHLTLPLIGAGSDGFDVTVPAACVAAALLAACAGAVILAIRRYRAEMARAHAATRACVPAGELAVLQDSDPDAYALPGRPGRIVVTTGMLRALAPGEREALLAHERAHLVGRHHLFIVVAALAATCHPLLRGLRAPLSYALERWADESAAAAIGDRRLAARAVGRAALAARTVSSGRPSAALAMSTGPVPRRVAALLHAVPPVDLRRSRGPRLVAALLAGCLLLSAAAAVEGATDLHEIVETAQGE